MVKYSENALNAVFTALADPTRRGVVKLLSEGSRPVSELSRQFEMSLDTARERTGPTRDERKILFRINTNSVRPE